MFFDCQRYISEEVNDEFKFCFNEECTVSNKPVTIWKADPDICYPFGTLIINFKDGCDKLYIFVNDCETPVNEVDPLKPGETFSRTFSCLNKVTILCKTSCFKQPLSKCCGNVCISLHYYIAKYCC